MTARLTVQVTVLCLSAAWALAVVPVAASPGRTVMPAMRTEVSPAVDGNPDGVYAERAVPGGLLAQAADGSLLPDEARIDLLYDADALYLLLILPDNPGETRGADVELRVGAATIRLSPATGIVRTVAGMPRRCLQAAAAPHPAGRCLEVRVAFSPYGLAAPNPGDTLPFSLRRNGPGAHGEPLTAGTPSAIMPAAILFASPETRPGVPEYARLRSVFPDGTRIFGFVDGGVCAVEPDGTGTVRSYADLAATAGSPLDAACARLSGTFERMPDLPRKDDFDALRTRLQALRAPDNAPGDPLSCARRGRELQTLAEGVREILYDVRLELLNRTL